MRLSQVMVRMTLIPAIFFFFAGQNFGQEKLSINEQINVYSWPKEANLPRTIQTMTQDADGYLWMGCDYGIVRFDGFTQAVFNRQSVPLLTMDDCQAIYSAKDSTIYFGMVDGLLFSFKDGQFHAIGDTGSFGGKSITRICEEASGALWIGTDRGGLFNYDGERFKQYTVDDGIPAMGIDALCAGEPGEVWVGSTLGLCLIDQASIRRFTVMDGISFNGISSLFRDTTGILWIGGFTGGLMKYDHGQFSTVQTNDLPAGSSIQSICMGPEGLIWIGTAKGGVVVYDPVNNTSFRITEAEGLSRDMIRCLLLDREGDLLIGTEDGGLNRIKKTLLKSYTTNNGLTNNTVMSLYADPDGKVWIGCVDGSITCFADGKFINKSKQFDIKSPPIFSIGGGQSNTIWVAPFGDMVSFNGDKRTLYPTRKFLPNDLFHAVYESRDGTIWAGTDAGILLIREGKFSTLTRKDGLTDGRIFCFLEDRSGSMWIGTQDGGINIYRNGILSSITSKDGLSDNMILCFYEDPSGSMWVGTGHAGLNRIDGQTGKITQVNSAIGYPRYITYITGDQNGNLWYGTEIGIASVPIAELEAFVAGGTGDIEVRHFTQSEGMTGNECTTGTFPAGCLTQDGEIWFATSDGITVVDPDDINYSPCSQRVFIQAIFVNGKEERIQKSYTLSPGVIQLEVRYSAPSFIAPDKLQFRYQLDGYDKTWVDAGLRRSAYYTKVPPGDYTFRVQVRNHHGQWSDQEASVVIIINPFFYQTVWFLILCILLGFLLIYGILRYRVRYVREKELEILVEQRTSELRELNRDLDQRVLDRTAELAATNQELESFTYSVSHDLRAPVRRIEALVEALNEDHSSQLDETGKDFLKKVSDSSTEMGQLIEEFLKLARIARQEIDKTELNLTELASEIAEELSAVDPRRTVTFYAEPGITGYGDSRLIRIVMQNLLGNAWKYTGKVSHPEILFGSLKEGGQTVYFIRDNGVGFDMGHYDKLFTPFLRLHSDDQFSGTGIGLATVKRIILKHGGRIWAKSEQGNGCTFFFTL